MNRTDLHHPLTLGERVADRAAGGIGSWRFIIVQASLLLLWIVLNTVGIVRHWDPAPFILLNLMLSFQAAFTGPLVMLSQNRQAQKDRARDDLEAEEVAEIHEGLALLKQVNAQQLEILQELRGK